MFQQNTYNSWDFDTIWLMQYEGYSYPALRCFNPSVSGIVLDKTSYTLNVGESFDLTATVMPMNAVNKWSSWSSSDSSIAQIGSEGYWNGSSHATIRGIRAGTAIITATSGADSRITAICLVTVIGEQEGMEVTMTFGTSSLTCTAGSFDAEEVTINVCVSNLSGEEQEHVRVSVCAPDGFSFDDKLLESTYDIINFTLAAGIVRSGL